MKLSKQVSDAIRILSACHRAGDQLVKVGRIAEELELTKQVALKTTNVLAQAGLLETVRGPHGGIRLASDASDLSIGAIVRALEGVPERGVTPQGAPELGLYLDDAFEAFLEVLDRHKLADLAAESPPKRRTKRKPPAKAARNRDASYRRGRAGSAASRQGG